MNELSRQQEKLLSDLQSDAFQYFIHEVNPDNGLVVDSTKGGWPSSIAAVGMALSVYPVGVEHGFITRAEAIERTLKTLRFFTNSEQSTSPNATGYKGFYYHFLDMKSGRRAWRCELSTIDSTFLFAGMLAAAAYFDRDAADENEIRKLADDLYRRADWIWATNRGAVLTEGWTPEGGFLPYNWQGYDESTLAYVLGLGAPAFPLSPESYQARLSGCEWKKVYDYEYLFSGPLFTHQFSHIWIDFRGIQDEFMRAHGLDYFENSRRATYAQQAYAIANPRGCKDYGATIWGLTASDGPADMELTHGTTARLYKTYAARGAGEKGTYDDCTLAPTAAVASLPFAPELAMPAVLDMHKRFGKYIYSQYGFLDAFNRNFEFDGPIPNGKYIPGFGWVDSDYLGIDQGAIFAMIENYRSSMIWTVMRTNPYIRQGLTKAGFEGGWLTASAQ